MDIDRADFRALGRRQPAVQQALESVGFLDDHLGVLGEFRAIEFGFEELRRAAYAAEWIANFMGDTRR